MLRTLESAAAVSKHDSVQLPGGGVCALLQCSRWKNGRCEMGRMYKEVAALRLQLSQRVAGDKKH